MLNAIVKYPCRYVVVFCVFIFACADNRTQDELIADETNTSEWLSYGRTHSEDRFSPITDIDTANVGNLRPDWYIDLPNDRSLVSTPLVINNKLFFTGTANIIRAVDATNGRLLWT